MTNINNITIKTFHFLSLAVLAALFFINRPLYAQSAHSGNYVIEQRYLRLLVWIGDEYTIKYEVVIERGEGKTYRAFSREFTENPSLLVSLPPGNYRYMIISYDYFEQPGGVSEWVNLEIKPATVVPVEVQTEEDGSYIIRSPGSEPIVPGVGEIVIKNPAELETENGVLVVDEKKAGGPSKTLFYLNAAWSPLIPLYGGIQEVFGNNFYAQGASLRFGAFYNKQNWLFIPGLELSTSWFALNKTNGGDTVLIQAGVTGINIVAQKKLPNSKMAITLRAGGALAFQTGEIDTADETNTIGGLAPQFKAEASFLYQVWKNFYAETGLSFTFHLNKNNSSGYLNPWLGAGWKF